MSGKMRIILMLLGLAAAWILLPLLSRHSVSELWQKAQGYVSTWQWPSGTSGESSDLSRPDLPPARQQEAIRIATFNVVPLDQEKVERRGVLPAIAAVVRKYDVIALQGVDCRDRSVLARLMDEINRDGGTYRFATVPQPRRLSIARGSVFIFDQRSVVVDRTTVWPVEDPQRRLAFLPLMGAFRARGVPEEEAFTFTLVSVHVDPTRAAIERELLDDIYRAVRDDGRGEDDIILLGDLGNDHRNLGPLAELPDIGWVVSGTPTTLDGGRSVDNIVFDRRACIEYTGRSGVVDLIREFSVTPQQAHAVADHVPVWAEFSVREGAEL